MDTRPNIKEAYKKGYLSPCYHRDRDLISKYSELLETGHSKQEAIDKLVNLMGYSLQYIYRILKRWDL